VPVFDLGSRQLVARLVGPAQPVTAVRFSMDGKRIASATEGGLLTVWDLATARAIKTLPGDAPDIRTVAWSPDGTLLVTVSVDHVVTLWELATGKVLHREPLVDFESGLITFSDDGKQLVLAQAATESVLDDPEVPAAVAALKLWALPGMKSLTPPPVGQRSELIGWLAREDPRAVFATGLYPSLFERRISVHGLEIETSPPDLVKLVDSGLLSIAEGSVGWATDSHRFTGPPMTFGSSDTFGQLIGSAGDPSIHLRLCAELDQVPMARLIWQNSRAKLDPEAQRDYVLLMARAGRADEVADAVTKPMLEDPVIAAGVMTLLRSLPAETQAKLKASLQDKAPSDWLEKL
jgi:hypothetical protein